MAVRDKYQPLIDLANQSGVTNLQVNEDGDVLHVTGYAPSEEAKQKVWDEYNRIDPDMRSGDLVLDLEVSGAAARGGGDTYTVQKGDTLSKIGQRHNVPWREIFEANRDQLDNPNDIRVGQTLKIPPAVS